MVNGGKGRAAVKEWTKLLVVVDTYISMNKDGVILVMLPSSRLERLMGPVF